MTVEDGSGRVDADSYVSVERADAYHLTRGNGIWVAASVANRTAALVRACDYLERGYGRLWQGARTMLEQRLSFPRFGIGNLRSTEIPSWMIEAQCEAALLELRRPGCLSESWSEGGSLAGEREGEISKSYRPGIETLRKFPAIYGILAPYIRNPSQVKMERA